MATRHLEVERAFSPGIGAELPDLTEVGGIVAMEAAAVAELDATYYDVPGLRLLRAGVTLRRRSGGSDEGWHLKLPGNDVESRTELHVGLDHDELPDELLGLVSGWTRGQAPAPVARIRTRRQTHRLVGPDGTVLAELADDRVEGLPAQLGAEPRRWREWEVELVHGEPRLLDAVAEHLAARDVHPAAVQRKIAQVLASPEPGQPEPASKKGPARLLLHRWILDQVGEIARLDPVARQAGEAGVHGMRKACRRLRAGLATYRRLVDREATDPLREELRWLARALGSARDDAVVRTRIDALLDREPGDVAGARLALEQYAAPRAERDVSELSATLGSQRYFALRTALDDLAAEPPWRAPADEQAREVMPDLVRREWKRVQRRHRELKRGADPHGLRKAAKRLRYAYELVEPVWGKTAKEPRRAARELTRVLGDRQDALVAREWLVELAALAGGPAGLLLGRLHAQEELAEAGLLEQAERAWRELRSVRW